MQSMSLVVWGRRVTLLLVMFVACGPSVNFAGLKMEQHRTKYHERILVQTLDNGLRVAVVPDYRSNQISVGVNYDVGASDDPEGADGLAHYAEHVMFYAAYRGADGPALNEVDLDKNAWTLLDRTYFTLSALASELDPAIELTARRFETGCDDLDAATLERERDVVIEEAKLKASGLEVMAGLDAAVWGRGHVYGHDAGGHGFATIQRPALCTFVADHYGPSSAVVVITGNLSDPDYQRIRARLERIPARPAAPRTRTPIATAPTASARIVLNEIEHPTALLVFPAPGEGGTADAAIDAVQGRRWMLERGAPARYAYTVVVGEERQRAIIAAAEVSDAKQLDELSAAMRRSFAKAKMDPAELEQYRQLRRTALAAELDDPFASAEDLAVAIARGQKPTRFRALQQLAPLTPTDVTRWFDNPSARAAFLLPQVGSHGKAHVAEVATSLHDHEIGRANPASPLLHLPDARPKLDLVERRLPNGLRVVLATDPGALAMEARLVITGTRDPDLARDAASRLAADLDLTPDVVTRLRWYNGVGAFVIGQARGDTTTFQISGLTEYGDWHVWHLASIVVHGAYDARVLDFRREHAGDAEAKPPGTDEVVARRLAGAATLPDGKHHVPSADALEAFREANYRPDHATLIVTGNFDVAAMEKEISTLFGDWKSDGGAATAASAPRVGTAVGIEASDEATVEFALAFAPAKPFEDAAARAVLAEIVNARMRVVRERLGASYGVQVDASKRALRIEGAVEPAYATEAFKAIAEELAKIRANDPMLAEEFARAKNHVLAHALAMPAAASKRATMIARAVVDGDEVDAQVQAIRGVEVAAVQRAAAGAIDPARMIAAVRGDRRAVVAALDALGVAKGTIEWIEDKKAGGQPVRPAETPKVAGLKR